MFCFVAGWAVNVEFWLEKMLKRHYVLCRAQDPAEFKQFSVKWLKKRKEKRQLQKKKDKYLSGSVKKGGRK